MIAPHELKNKVFNKSVRGYNCAEVDEYIEFLIDKYTEIYRQNSELEQELHMTKVKYSELHNDEDSIRAVILKAQKFGENLIQQSRNEADKIIASAKENCQAKIDEAEDKVKESRREVENMRLLAEKFRSSLYEQYVEHIKVLKEMDISMPTVEESDIRNEVNTEIDKQTELAKANLSNKASRGND